MLTTISKHLVASLKRFGSRSFSTATSQVDLIDTVHKEIKQQMLVWEDFLSVDEENSLFSEIEPYIKRLRYQFEHWDDAIHGYRESERTQWKPENKIILNRVKQHAFDSFKNSMEMEKGKDEPEHSSILSHIHILDLDKEGYIKPHVDAVRFCGNTIAGLSLLSDSVMKLTHVKDENKFAVVWLKRRSLYIMKDDIRYNYKHEILKDSESYFKGEHVKRDRRISVICRNRPDPRMLNDDTE